MLGIKCIYIFGSCNNLKTKRKLSQINYIFRFMNMHDKDQYENEWK